MNIPCMVRRVPSSPKNIEARIIQIDKIESKNREGGTVIEWFAIVVYCTFDKGAIAAVPLNDLEITCHEYTERHYEVN